MFFIIALISCAARQSVADEPIVEVDYQDFDAVYVPEDYQGIIVAISSDESIFPFCNPAYFTVLEEYGTVSPTVGL